MKTITRTTSPQEDLIRTVQGASASASQVDRLVHLQATLARYKDNNNHNVRYARIDAEDRKHSQFYVRIESLMRLNMGEMDDIESMIRNAGFAFLWHSRCAPPDTDEDPFVTTFEFVV